jgi:hypothetical protein
MKKRILITVLAGLLALSVAAPAMGAQPPGQLGGGGSQHNSGGGGNGPSGYEGQPGNQGG